MRSHSPIGLDEIFRTTFSWRFLWKALCGGRLYQRCVKLIVRILRDIRFNLNVVQTPPTSSKNRGRLHEEYEVYGSSEDPRLKEALRLVFPAPSELPAAFSGYGARAAAFSLNISRKKSGYEFL